MWQLWGALLSNIFAQSKPWVRTLELRFCLRHRNNDNILCIEYIVYFIIAITTQFSFVRLEWVSPKCYSSPCLATHAGTLAPPFPALHNNCLRTGSDFRRGCGLRGTEGGQSKTLTKRSCTSLFYLHAIQLSLKLIFLVNCILIQCNEDKKWDLGAPEFIHKHSSPQLPMCM